MTTTMSKTTGMTTTTATTTTATSTATATTTAAAAATATAQFSGIDLLLIHLGGLIPLPRAQGRCLLKV